MTCVGLATEEHLFSGALRIEEKVKKKKKVRERRAVKFNSIAFVFMVLFRLFPE